MVDPQLAVVRWSLSPLGLARMQAFASTAVVRDVDAVFCSTETKAVEAARVLGERVGVTPVEIEALGENDRTATGFLPPPAFEAAADAFFAHPQASYRGWERAVDAQRRIVTTVQGLLRKHQGRGDILIVSHGAVGTLLKCHLKGVAITRAEDQPSQGHWYAFEAGSGALLHDWRALEAAA